MKKVIIFIILNKALSLGGFSLEVQKDYKCKKPIIIYNYFTSDLDNKIINNSNQIKLSQNSELTLIEYNITEKSKFFKNTFENVNIGQGSLLKSILYKKQKAMVIFIKIYQVNKIITLAIKILY